MLLKGRGQHASIWALLIGPTIGNPACNRCVGGIARSWQTGHVLLQMPKQLSSQSLGADPPANAPLPAMQPQATFNQQAASTQQPQRSQPSLSQVPSALMPFALRTAAHSANELHTAVPSCSKWRLIVSEVDVGLGGRLPPSIFMQASGCKGQCRIIM